MTQQLFKVGMKHKGTGKKIDVNVWASSNEAASSKIAGVFFGRFNEYEWTGTSPVYENNEVVKRDF